MKRLYARFDPSTLEPHYSAHVSAMTSEGLHGKSEIAAELAHRDVQIESLRRHNQSLADELNDWRDKYTALESQLDTRQRGIR